MPYAAILLAALFAAAATAQTADLLITNARIYPGDGPTTNALAVRGGRIAALGADALKLDGKRIDLGGAAVVPGFIDSHVHMRGLGEFLENLDLRDTTSPAAVAQLVREAVRTKKPGEWVLGRAWDQTRYPGGQFPTAGDLDAVSPDNPVYLTRVDGHAAWVNRKALDLADVNAASADPAGGRIIRDAQKRPTGVLIDRAMGLVSVRIPGATPQQIKARVARAAEECARLGLTTVHDAGVSSVEIAAYRELIAEGKLPVRLYAMIGGEGALWREYLQRGPETGERLSVRSIKLMADGALGSRGAALKEPYTDEPGNRGLLILQREDVERVARAAVERGFQVNTHAIGDRANRMVLDAYAAALGGRNDRRFRVEHAQVVSLDDVALFAKYSILASMQATHASSDMRWAEQRLGPRRVLGAYAWQRFLDAGVPIANGSDFPVESANPLLGFYAAITRQDEQGLPAGGWMPQQRMSREQAFKSWTQAGAYAAFEETWKGTLAVGKAADFVVLSGDIMRISPAAILQTRVRMTVVSGEIVYQDGK